MKKHLLVVVCILLDLAFFVLLAAIQGSEKYFEYTPWIGLIVIGVAFISYILLQKNIDTD